jgi:TolA-binding protein
MWTLILNVTIMFDVLTAVHVLACFPHAQGKVREGETKLSAASQAQQQLQEQLEDSRRQLEAAKGEVQQLQQQLQKEQDEKVCRRQMQFRSKRVYVKTPPNTRTAPLPYAEHIS